MTPGLFPLCCPFGEIAMADHPSIADWITAASTAATAIAAALAGWIAFAALRRDTKASLPTIETDIRWCAEADGEQYILLEVLIRNPRWETIIIESAKVVAPRNATISDKFKYVNGTMVRQIRGDGSSIDMNVRVGSYGSESDLFSPGRPQRSDICRHEIYLLPPPDWSEGSMRVDLRISSKALTIRHKRIVIRRRIGARPKRQIEENANNQGTSIPQ
jgi:hypothetical protein